MQIFTAFDIEQWKELPAETTDLDAERPLGMSCASWMTTGMKEPVMYGEPGRAMTTEEVDEFIGDLVFSSGRLVTWGGLGYDFRTLAEEGTQPDLVKRMALAHIDGMWQFFCTRGFCIGLDAIAKGMGLPGKTEGMSGAFAPTYWRNPKLAPQIIDYLKQDVRTTLAVAEKFDGTARWLSKKGKPTEAVLGPWMTVEECDKLPLPDVSWMRDGEAWSRSKFRGWIDGN